MNFDACTFRSSKRVCSWLFHAEGMSAPVSHTPSYSCTIESSWDLASTKSHEKLEGKSIGIDKHTAGPAWSVRSLRRRDVIWNSVETQVNVSD